MTKQRKGTASFTKPSMPHGRSMKMVFHRLLLILCLPLAFTGWVSAAVAQSWTQVPNSGAVTSAAVLANGTILGVGMNKGLWTRATLTSDWKQVPNSGAVISVAVMADGTILGVGMDNGLWTRATLTSDWKQVPNSGAVISVAVMADGAILGVGMDKGLWTRATLTSDWKQVPNSGAVTSVAVMADGTILGVGMDKGLWTRATLTSDWKQVPNSGAVISVAALPNGLILGVGVDNTLQTQSKDSLLVANTSSASPTKAASDPAPCTDCPPWVSRSFTGSYLPLAAQADSWSNPKPFNRASGQMTVQSRFTRQKGTTCEFDVQFNNVGSKSIDEGIIVNRPGKAAVSAYDHVIRIRLNPGASYAFGTEVRECPLNWGETKNMSKCASCEPLVYFVAP